MDLSHEIQKRGLAPYPKDSNWINNLIHPPQSPDLHPMEGIRNILKQRGRRRVFNSVEELMGYYRMREQSYIKRGSVRISDMPRRFQVKVKTGGNAIKSVLW